MNIINDMLVDKCFPDNQNARAVVPAYKDKTVSGSPITLTDSAENKPLGMKLYGWSKQDGTPSPDNPVEIESAGMKWSTGKNLFDCEQYATVDTSHITYKGHGNFTISSRAYAENYDRVYFNVNDIVTLSLKWKKISATSVNSAVEVRLYYKNGERSVRRIVLADNSGNLRLTTYRSDLDFFTFGGWAYAGVIEIEEMQLEVGSEATDYEPYDGGIPKPYGDKVRVGVRGKNLFDADRLDGVNQYGVALHVENGIIYAEGEATQDAWITANLTKDEIQRLFEGGKYTITQQKFGNVNFDAGLYFSFIPTTFQNGTIELTIPESIKDGDVYYFINITKGVKYTGGIRVMLNKGDTAPLYEPYRTPQSAAIITPNGLPGIPVQSNTAGITYTDAAGQAWIADEIDFKRGKYVQRVWYGEFDGSENWLAYDYMKGFLLATVLPYTMTNRAYLSNQYASNLRIGMGQKSLYLDSSSFYDASLDDKGLSNFKAHLAANPLVVMTYLDTPIERDLTSAELAEYTQLYSYKPTTLIENNSGCWMDVTYKAGTSGKSKNEALRWYFKNVQQLIDDGKEV